jgi:FKBP-type peptidyl-prolyl cis-trans isomerase FklB
MKKIVVITCLSALALAACQKEAAQAPAKVETESEILSYTIGYRMAQSIKRDDLDVDPAVVALAVSDVLGGAKPRLTDEQMHAALVAFRDKRIAERKALAEQNKKAGDEYRAANKAKEGVVELPSGVQYKIIEEGSGPQPTSEDTVVANYRGTFINGKEFDSSYTRGEPATFPVSGVIEGWQEVLPLMKQGAKWQVVIPPEHAYGESGAGDAIGPNETLLFDIELVEVKKKK